MRGDAYTVDEAFNVHRGYAISPSRLAPAVILATGRKDERARPSCPPAVVPSAATEPQRILGLCWAPLSVLQQRQL